MTIQELTDDQRTWLQRYKSRGPGILRIIDALTDELAAAEQVKVDLGGKLDVTEARVRELTATLSCESESLIASESRVRELEKLNRAHEQRWLAAEREGMTAESNLAAATALLKTCPASPGSGDYQWHVRKRDFLAIQPTAPTQDAELDSPPLVTEAQRDLEARGFERVNRHAAPTRTEAEPDGKTFMRDPTDGSRWCTEAEQHVLDAMAVLPIRRVGPGTYQTNDAALFKAFEAELALRGLK